MSNPFAALLETTVVETEKVHENINYLEDIFAITLDVTASKKKHVLYMEEVAQSFHTKEMTVSILQHVLFDRLFMCNEMNQRKSENEQLFESKVLVYLLNCYLNLAENKQIPENERLMVKKLIVENSVTAFIQSDIYEGQNLEEQMLIILKENSTYALEYFKDICKGVLNNEDGGEECLKNKLTQMLLGLILLIEKCNLITFDYSIFNVLNAFSTEDYLANIFLDVKPMKLSTQIDYTKTPIGSILNISIVPKTPSLDYEFFQDTSDQTSIRSTENIVWSNTEKLTEQVHTLIMKLLTRSSEIKNKTLEWMGNCLKANRDRGKLWNSQYPLELNPSNYTTVSDGFMVNFGNVMLKLSRPFCSNSDQHKVLKVDPTYGAVPENEAAAKGIHLPELSSETSLLPKNDEVENKCLIAEQYNFVTECFYFTHRAIDLGYRVTVDKLVHLNHEMGRLERAYVDAVAQATGNNDVVDGFKKRITQQLTKYLSLKAQLSDPILINLLMDFVSASTYWLNQIAVTNDEINHAGFLSANIVSFPLPAQIPSVLQYIPEFIVENIVCYLIFLKRFNSKIFEERGYDKLKPILTFILIYMGSSGRMKNPHLRARLAEALESLLPYNEDKQQNFNQYGGYQRELLFTQHEYRGEIVNSLLEVFVGIEMTGQSVEFEQKFNYRRPMYNVMHYLWIKDEYKQFFKKLAEYAENNMEAVEPPLFLRFVNLLMNDAVYLLDEALSNMAKLKEMQAAKENGEWDSLPAQERTQNFSYMHHIGMIAKFDNVLGRDTIKTLQKLTSEITIVFTHPTMIDRVAAMLNYFLYNLVGPKKKNFKVKDKKEYSFDPANTVLAICQIYVNLKDNENFCMAVSRDGRSYSPQLFNLAEDVLIRIGGGAIIGELKEVALCVERKAKEQRINEEVIAEAPEHFLDPIMSTLMVDPVILPSSKQTVDRTTIARHLLSDQTDPFNRAPLSMDQVVPNAELANEIDSWLAQRKRK